MPISYTQLAGFVSEPAWQLRVQYGLLQYCANEPGILQSPPAAASDTSTAALKDKLARAVLANPAAWAEQFAPVVALGFLGGADLSATNVSDAAIYSRIAVVFADLLPNV